MGQLAPTQVLVGSGFLTYFPLPYNTPENCFLRILFGAELCRSLAFNQRQMFLEREKEAGSLALDIHHGPSPIWLLPPNAETRWAAGEFPQGNFEGHSWARTFLDYAWKIRGS